MILLGFSGAVLGAIIGLVTNLALARIAVGVVAAILFLALMGAVRSEKIITTDRALQIGVAGIPFIMVLSMIRFF